MAFDEKYLPRADVVFTVMFLNKALCEKTLEAVLGETIELIDIVAEYKNDLKKAALNSIYFDVKTQAVDGRIVTLDLQRVYSKERIRKRTIYYACREIASQKVIKSKYENLKSVIVTFILTEAPKIHTSDNSVIQLVNKTTGEVYTDLLTVHEINMKHISHNNSIELQILKAFFEITTEKNYKDFVSKYQNMYIGRLLLQAYDDAISNPTVLDNLVEEDKYMLRLTDEERLRERKEGREEGRKEGREEGRKEGRKEGKEEGRKEGKEEERIKFVKNLLNKDMSVSFISEVTGLSEQEIKDLDF